MILHQLAARCLDILWFLMQKRFLFLFMICFEITFWWIWKTEMSKQFNKMDIEQLVQAALREKSWNETIFKIIVGRINVLSICNVLYSYFFTMQKKILYLLFEKIYHGGKFNDTLHTNSVAFDSDIYRYNWAYPSCCNYFTHHILGDWNGSGSFKLCK